MKPPREISLKALSLAWWLALVTNAALGFFQIWYLHFWGGWICILMTISLLTLRSYLLGRLGAFEAMQPDYKIEYMDGTAYVTPKHGEPYMIRVPEDLELEGPDQIMAYVREHLR
ncbi:MAG TPA: hypothetical protein VLI07_18840 [Candidatus Binatus sp.]|nr:hypothetical protein [Candidatus Binatus sp.]